MAEKVYVPVKTVHFCLEGNMRIVIISLVPVCSVVALLAPYHETFVAFAIVIFIFAGMANTKPRNSAFFSSLFRSIFSR